MYCYSKFGFYSCDPECRCRFDISTEPNLEFGTWPACDFVNRLGRGVDRVSAIEGLDSAGVTVISMFTPSIQSSQFRMNSTLIKNNSVDIKCNNKRKLCF